MEFEHDTSLKVMTYNIRYDTNKDGENKWCERKDRVIELINDNKVDLLGVQEALPGQMKDLRKELHDYDSYGVGRDTGTWKACLSFGVFCGEFCGIFYRLDRFERLAEGTFWLPKTGRVDNTEWKADWERICSWVKLKDRLTGNEIYHFNTHLDHKIEDARQKSTDLILKTIEEEAGSAIPVILTGDFNTGHGSQAYRTIITNTGFVDAKLQSESGRSGPCGTWSTFNVKEDSDIDYQIDYIFVTPKHFETLEYKHLTDSHNGYYPSDHLPVLAKLRYKT